MTITSKEKIKELLTRGVEEALVKEDLEKELSSKRPLRIKLGIDPTASDLHLGHAAMFLKLKDFQDLGHKIIFLIGDFTAKVGDPSGKLISRPLLSDKEIKENMKNYKLQAAKILDIKKTEIRYNGEWFLKMKAEKFYRLSLYTTIDQILQRDLYKEREKSRKPLRLYEVFYPLLQGYDSVMLKCDVEIGGTDQLFNLKYGRELQREFNQKPQNILTVKLLVGTDGLNKMSKSLGNYISLQDSSGDIYGKIMSIPDNLIFDYFELITRLPLEEIYKIKEDLEKGIISERDTKARLAYEVVKTLNKEKEAIKAQEDFNRVFKEHKLPDEIKEYKLDKSQINIIDLLTNLELASSKTEAKRLIEEGAVEIDGIKIINWHNKVKLKDGAVIKVGPRRFVKIRI